MCSVLYEVSEAVRCLLPKLTISTGHLLSGLSGVNAATHMSHLGSCPKVHGDSVNLVVQKALGGAVLRSRATLRQSGGSLTGLSTELHFSCAHYGIRKGRQLRGFPHQRELVASRTQADSKTCLILGLMKTLLSLAPSPAPKCTLKKT